MSNAEKLKRLRSAAKGSLTRAINILNNHIDEKAELDIVELLFEDVVRGWKNVEAKQERYVEAVEAIDSEQEDTWMAEVEGSFRKARISVHTYKRGLAKEVESERVRSNFRLEEKRFYEGCDSLSEAMAGGLPVELIDRKKETIRGKYEELNERAEELEREVGEESKMGISNMTEVRKYWNKIKLNVEAYCTKCLNEKDEKSRLLGVHKIPLPTFDGKVRSYARFRKDFQEIVLPYVKKVQQPFSLRQCLPKEVIDNVIGACCDNVDEMFERLDKKYGDSGKIVEAVVKEIEKCKKVEKGDKKGFITLVDVIDRAHRDLKELKLEREICNLHFMSIIESKLPGDVEMDWYRKLHARHSDNSLKIKRKTSLLEFLLVERDALEYSLSEVRKTREIEDRSRASSG